MRERDSVKTWWRREARRPGVRGIGAEGGGEGEGSSLLLLELSAARFGGIGG